MKGPVCGLPLAVVLGGAVVAQEALPAGSYVLDPHHSTLRFSVSHLGFSDYVMSFDRFDAALELDPAEPGKAALSVTVEPASLDVPRPPEGFMAELMGETWLNVGAHPEITFASTGIEMTGEESASVTGDLTLLGVTGPVVLEVTFNGGYRGHPMDPNARIGFSAEGRFNRSDFGMGYGVPAPGTTMGVGDEVTVRIETEFTGPAMEDKKD
ncbi:MAG: YceI family protein [Phycisphaerales bacterium]